MRMGPYGQAQDHATRAKTEAGLRAEIAEQYPGWDVADVFGGFEAVPAGTPVLRSVTLDGLLGKLADHARRTD
jgi:hypothetical protein